MPDESRAALSLLIPEHVEAIREAVETLPSRTRREHDLWLLGNDGEEPLAVARRTVRDLVEALMDAGAQLDALERKLRDGEEAQAR